jgi:hypothetical protein
MKKAGISFLMLLSLWLAGTPKAVAQANVHFVAPNMSVEPGNYFLAPIKVAGFRRIVGVQYSMNWNPEVLRFDGIMNPALNAGIPENFGLSGVESGVLTFSWYDQTLTGMTLPDSASLYLVRFQAIGSAGSATAFTFGNMPTTKEVVDTSFQAITAGFYDGLISVMNPNSIADIADVPVNISDCTPNPISNTAFFDIGLKEARQSVWTMYAPNGSEVYTASTQLGAGNHRIPVQVEKMVTPGTYFCKFFFEDGTYISRKLIKI